MLSLSDLSRAKMLKVNEQAFENYMQILVLTHLVLAVKDFGHT
jgi:hypothetical protein